MYGDKRNEPRAPERIESWMLELKLSHDEMQSVRRTYQEVGYDRAFALATQYKVSRNKEAKKAA